MPLGRNYLLLIYEVLIPMTEDERMFAKLTVQQLIFGYLDPVLSLANMIEPSVDPFFPGVLGNATSERDARDKIPPSQIYTGRHHPDKIRQFVKWQNKTHHTVCGTFPCPPNPMEPGWATWEASEIIGCDGSQFPPGTKKTDKLRVWDASAFRSFQLEYSHDATYKGIKLNYFVIPDHTRQNSTINPHNWLYYQDGANGLFNITKSAQNVPAFASKVHFEGVDRSVVENVVCAWPTHLNYDMFYGVEPIGGSTLHIRGGSQFNIFISPLPNMPIPDSDELRTWFATLRPTIVPVMWASQSASIGDDDAKTLADGLSFVHAVNDVALYGGVVFGFILFFSAIFLIYWSLRKKKQFIYMGETQTLLASSNNETMMAQKAKSSEAGFQRF